MLREDAFEIQFVRRPHRRSIRHRYHDLSKQVVGKAINSLQNFSYGYYAVPVVCVLHAGHKGAKFPLRLRIQ